MSHLFSVGLWVQGSLGQQDRMFFRGDTKFIVEGVMPDLFHVVPVSDDTVFDRILEGEDTTFRLGLVVSMRIEGAEQEENLPRRLHKSPSDPCQP